VPISDTISFGSLGVIPNSIRILSPEDSLFYQYYSFDPVHLSFSTIAGPAPFDSVQFSYKLFPDFILADYQDRDTSSIVPFLDDSKWKKSTSAHFKKQTSTQALSKTGSISRTVLGGSVQDVSIKSEMDLQLSGKIGEDTYIKASINDSNLPSQQEGYSQKLKEFDQIFVEVNHKDHTIRAGDIRYFSDRFSLFRANKKAAGLVYGYANDSTMLRFGGGISRGKFNNQPLVLTEGNNGPYRLKGANGESWITVISGSERVVMNGKLLKRGLQQDYTINYNTAEITFTNKHLISPQVRIYVEFEYSELSYNRSLYFADAQFKKDDWQLDISYFSEQDLKLQPVQQQLSSDEKLALNLAGDSIINGETAVQQDYRENSLLYEKKDSLGYTSVFVFSADTSKQLYAVSYSDVGDGNGDYIQNSELSALGIVYEWKAPIGGVAQGRYVAKKVLIAPKQLKNLQLKLKKTWAKGLISKLELGYSQEDKNLFSSKDDADNAGLAVIFQQIWEAKVGKNTVKASWKNSYIPSKYKSPYILRDIEFQRNWNLGETAFESADEYWTGLAFKLSRDTSWFMSLNTDYIQKGSNYSGIRNQWESNRKGDFADWYVKSFWLQNESDDAEGSSYKFQQSMQYDQANWKHSLEMNIEHNELKDKLNNVLSIQSFSLDEWKGTSSFSNDSSKWLGLKVNFRNDRIIDSLEFSNFSRSLQTDLNGKLIYSWGTLTSEFKFKNIHYFADTLQQDEQILSSNFGYQHAWSENRIRFKGMYENGKGQEARLRISYIQVPDGQGNYIWVDYNENDIKEPNEFEQAIFSEQANYIRLLSPENDYISVFKHGLNFNIDIEVGDLWSMGKRWKRLELEGRLELSNTLRSLDWQESWNPFIDYSRENISQQQALQIVGLKNIFPTSRIRINSRYKDRRDTRLISFGLEENRMENWKTVLSIPLKHSNSLESELNYGGKQRHSENFSERNFDLLTFDFEQSWKQKIGTSWKLKSGVNYSFKENDSEEMETLKSLSLFIENELNTGSSQALFSKLTYLRHSYNATDGTTIAYEMLQGLKKGDNMVWELNWRKRLSKSLELNLVYQGRKSEGIRAIHSGQVQLRALF